MRFKEIMLLFHVCLISHVNYREKEWNNLKISFIFTMNKILNFSVLYLNKTHFYYWFDLLFTWCTMQRVPIIFLQLRTTWKSLLQQLKMKMIIPRRPLSARLLSCRPHTSKIVCVKKYILMRSIPVNIVLASPVIYSDVTVAYTSVKCFFLPLKNLEK